jgi:hypothetical protein
MTAQGERVMNRFLTLAFLGFLATACSQEDIMRKIAPPAQQEIARNYIEQLRNRDFYSIEKAADPSIAAEFGGGTLDKMADIIPKGAPTSVKLVGANQFSSEKVGTTVNLTYEFQFGDQFLLINVARKMKDGVETIIGFRVQPLRASLEAQNSFSLSNKTALQYGVLAAAIGAAMFTLVALIICIRTKIARRKWLWILFILFGFGKIMVNWSTGTWDFRIFNFQLFSAGADANFFGPWIITVALPIGAAVFLARRKALAVTAAAGEGESVSAGQI